MDDEGTAPDSDFVSHATQVWKEQGGRLTVVREIICQCIAGRDAMFGADELFHECRKRDPGISISSVYRTLADLVKAELLLEIHPSREQRLFLRSAAATSTGHLICRDCRRVIPLTDNCLALREGAAIREMGFRTGGMHLQIEAACESLKRCGTCENQGRPETPGA